MRIVVKSFLRYLPRRRSLSLLQLMGIACGVAAVIGMGLSARTALSSFSRTLEFLQGKATHMIERPAGPIDEKILTRIMQDPAVRFFAPVIERKVRLSDEELALFLGIDPFLDHRVRPNVSPSIPSGRSGDRLARITSFLFDERSVIVDEGIAARLSIGPGSIIRTSRGPLKVTGTFPNPSAEPVILMDIGNAQKLFEFKGFVDRVDLVLVDEAGFRARWGQGFNIQSIQEQKATFGAMLSSFRLNLEALSLLALLVGVFLIYNTAMFAAVSRRKDAGILRSLGARKSEIIMAFLAEILTLGILGGLLGAFFGYVLSRFLTGLVGNTISSLYVFLRPAPPEWSWSILVTGTILGCTAGLFGSIPPLLELLKSSPQDVLRGPKVSRGRRSRRRIVRAACGGIALIIISTGFLLLSSLHVYVGFGGTFGVLIGASFLTGLVLTLSAPLLKWALVKLGGLPGKIAAGNVTSNLGRTSVAVAAFMVALSMSVGLSSMIGSFRESLGWWMDSQLRGDLYVGTKTEVQIPRDIYEAVKKIPGVAGVDAYRNTRISYRDRTVNVVAIDADVLKRFTRFGWLKGGNENWDPVMQGDVIISESFARIFGVGAGDSITLKGVAGPQQFRVAGVFYDYSSEHGVVMMDWSSYLRTFQDQTINSLGIFVEPDDPRKEAVFAQVRRMAVDRGLPVVTGAQLKKNILDVFDATFAVTRSMQILTIVVAFFGITGSLLTLFMERRREFGVYRALGFSTSQVALMTLLEGICMGLVSLLMSLFTGTAFAVILIKVINLYSFNWTIFYYPSWNPYITAGLTALLASIGAALYPIWKVCRTYPHMQIREE